MPRLIFDIETVGIDFNKLDEKSKEFVLEFARTPEEIEKEKESKNDIQCHPLGSEKEVLKEFWETAQLYDQFITFSGHSFDCPYLTIRSAILKIKPTKKIMGYRFTKAQDLHIDLYDQLTNFGAMREGRRNLHMWCQAFGIKSSKTKGVTGDNVGELFKNKKYMDIAQYCAGDLWATKELFNYWDKYVK